MISFYFDYNVHQVFLFSTLAFFLFFTSLLNIINNKLHSGYQAQASDQFLATTKLATNKAICLKAKKINKSKMYF